MMPSLIFPSSFQPTIALRQLRRCLAGFRHVVAETFTYEILVVDDGSPELLKPLIAHEFEALPIQWLWQANQGPAAARNFGVKMARGQFVAFIDDDCVPDAAWLTILWHTLKSRPSGMVGGQTINGLPTNLYAEASQQLVAYLYDYFTERNGRFFTSNNFALSKQLFVQVGGFDPSMPLAAGEDREFCARWLDAGLTLLYEPSAKIFHFHHLTFALFWQQHLNYGRGAKQFRRLRQNQKRAPAKLEPFRFYMDLLLCPIREKRPLRWNILPLIVLMGLTQLANAFGYFIE